MSRDEKYSGKFQKKTGWFNWKLWGFIGLGVCAVIAVALVILVFSWFNGGKDDIEPSKPTSIQMQSTSESSQEPAQTDAPETSNTAQEKEETQTSSEATEPKETKPKETKPKETEPKETKPKETKPKETKPKETKPKETKPKETEPKETEPKGTKPKETEPKETEPQETVPTVTKPVVVPTLPQETVPAQTVVHLPYTIPGTNLVIQRVASYDGIYLEDGSDVDTSGVAMMLLKNTGSEAVEYASIALKYNDKSLKFTVSALGAGDSVVVQEASRAGCATGDPTQCTADVATRAGLEMSQSQVSVADNGDNSITVTNLTANDIATVRVFYKYYMADEDVYVGGITYTAKISNLKAGESIVITPSHYSSEASTVVMVRTYDTDA